jgi:hypothetical protein
VDGHHWDGEVDIVGGARSDEHILYTLGKGSMVSVGAILGNTAHFASGRTRSGARLWVITRETMNRARRENPQAYDRVVARIGQRRADRIGLLPDTAFDMSASRPLLAPRTERDQLGCREVPGRAYFGVQTLRAVENFAISGVALRDFSHSSTRSRSSKRPRHWPSGRSVFELVREKGWLDDDELARLLAPEAMTNPRTPSECAVMPVGIPSRQSHVDEPAGALEAKAD